MDARTRYLFARPSFTEGIGRLFDFGGVLNRYNTAPSPEAADAIASALDYTVVRDEIDEAIRLTTA